MLVPTIQKILSTIALCLAAVGVSSCQQGVFLLEEALYVNNTSEWYAAENDMTNFYHVTCSSDFDKQHEPNRKRSFCHNLPERV